MSSTFAAVTGVMSQVVAGIALVSGGLALAVTRRPALALGILLDLLVAAGLLRLAGDPDWRAILSTAAVVALRHLVSYGLRLGAVSVHRGPAGGGAGHRPLPRRLQDLAHRALRPAWRP
ncbi:DUF1622 domain-containing protein [Blastococcus xanthinilyticus]|uniref:Uncharacterized protein DUF1622 n=1 Tax=Blastococcus xanthinilyticus TaxID=1564164 RepID=A0A5S5D224_9ACTN|nr:DUF1622 domain-containing protein [Blastococcus xanthinilyticus]TYP88862.1 uncharacterized protein DUF1622 [Blastococcus xanthinilyticus]